MSTQSSEKLLQDMMRQYCEQYVYPDVKMLREVRTQLSDEQKLHILQKEYSGWRPLHCAAASGDTQIISTLLTSLQSSVYRLKLLMVNKNYTPLHAAARWGNTESVKMILDFLTANQQIQIISVQWGGVTAIQIAEREGQRDIVRVLAEYQHRATKEMRYSKFTDLVIASKLLLVVCETYNHTYHTGGKFIYWIFVSIYF